MLRSIKNSLHNLCLREKLTDSIILITLCDTKITFQVTGNNYLTESRMLLSSVSNSEV